LLLIAPEGIEIPFLSASSRANALLIAPEGIEIRVMQAKRLLHYSFNRTRRN